MATNTDTSDQPVSTPDEDRQAVAVYRERYGEGPFIAADAVVSTSDGKVLLIRRSRPPGRGRLALPGGFVDRDEPFLDAALRELREETGLDLGPADLWANAPIQLRDRPDRDPRARIVSVAFHFALPSPSNALAVSASDDAADAAWVALGEALTAADFFSDHVDILAKFGLLDCR